MNSNEGGTGSGRLHPLESNNVRMLEPVQQCNVSLKSLEVVLIECGLRADDLDDHQRPYGLIPIIGFLAEVGGTRTRDAEPAVDSETSVDALAGLEQFSPVGGRPPVRTWCWRRSPGCPRMWSGNLAQ